jgi:hypothetical protein
MVWYSWPHRHQPMNHTMLLAMVEAMLLVVSTRFVLDIHTEEIEYM